MRSTLVKESIMENANKPILFGEYNEAKAQYIMPKGSPTELEDIKPDIIKAVEIASDKPEGIKFIHKENGAEFHICKECKGHTEEAFSTYEDAVKHKEAAKQPVGIGAQAIVNSVQRQR